MYQPAQNFNSAQNSMQQNSFCSAGNQMQWNQQPQQYSAQLQQPFNSQNHIMHPQQQLQYQQQLQVKLVKEKPKPFQ